MHFPCAPVRKADQLDVIKVDISFFLVPWESPYNIQYRYPIMWTAGIFSCPISRFSWKVNLANTDISSITLRNGIGFTIGNVLLKKCLDAVLMPRTTSHVQSAQLNKKYYKPRRQLLTYVAKNVTCDQAFLLPCIFGRWEVSFCQSAEFRHSPKKKERLIAGCIK